MGTQMMDGFNRHVLRVAVAQICQSMGWDAVQKSTHDALTDVMQRYLEEIGKVACSYTQICNRTNPNLDDLHLAFQDTGVVLPELENYVAQVDPVQFIHPFTSTPRCRSCRLQHPSSGEIVDRADFYYEHLPPLPNVSHDEPKDEDKEIPTEEVITKIMNPELSEKLKASPLKELNQVTEKSELCVKRRLDAVIFLPDSKRARLDIPANLNLDKKENLENTDGESLSPATPVSPYVPEELPKSPEEPIQKVPDVPKAKSDPPKTSVVTKAMVLPLKKLTPPAGKTPNPTKLETSVSSPKKAKLNIKSEKTSSPIKSPKKTASPILARRDSPLLSKHNVKSEKKSPSPKLFSPVKMRSPLTEKAPLTDKPSTTKKSESLGVKPEPLLKSPQKRSSPIKSPQSTAVVAKKGKSSPANVGNKTPKKKKKLNLEETSSLTTATKEVMNTPKLMIKLLPKSEDASVKSTSKSGQSSVTTPVKGVKTPTTPEAKKLKAKMKKQESDSKPVIPVMEKLKISNVKPEAGLKEHSKKKKKKKDKDKGKHKTSKVDKAELPIPKIRFKFDPSGESKVVDTKPTATPKLITGSGQSSSKKSSIVIETEKVSRSIITQTLSNNTLEYDLSKTYFCPVCKKQDDGSPMVGCDGCDEWCHWPCVGLIAAPPEDEEWHCPQCLLKREKNKKGKSKKKSKVHV